MHQKTARGLRELSADLATRQEILKTAQVLLCVAQNMTDQAIAGRLKALETTTRGGLRKLRTLAQKWNDYGLLAADWFSTCGCLLWPM
jgi:CelD/BcsL family acetyltransferase involved in cellulose biosynthesis